MREIALHGTLTAEDLVRSQYAHLRPRPIFVVLGLLAATLAVVVLGLLWFRVEPSDRPYQVHLVFAILVAYLGVKFFWLIPRRARKTFGVQRDLQEAVRLTLEDAGLRMTQGENHTLLEWRDCFKWREARDLFLVYRSDRLFHMIPKRFIGDGDEERVREVLLSRLGEPA